MQKTQSVKRALRANTPPQAAAAKSVGEGPRTAMTTRSACAPLISLISPEAEYASHARQVLSAIKWGRSFRARCARALMAAVAQSLK